MRSNRPKLYYASSLHSIGIVPRAPQLVCIFILLLLFASTKSAKAFDLQQYYEQNDNQRFHDKDEFYQSFPYDTYLQTVSFTDFKTLQKDRFFLYTKFGDGDEFLYHLAEKFLNTYPVSGVVDDIKRKIDIGELYLGSHQSPTKGFRNAKVNEIYIIIGYFILGKVAEKIGKEIEAKRYDESEPERAKIIDRLAKDRVFVTREESTVSKIATNLKQRNWRYFWQRLHSYARTYEKNVWVATIILAVFSFLSILIGRRTRLNSLRSLGVLGLLVVLIPVAVLKLDPPLDPTAQAQAPNQPAQTNLRLVSGFNLSPINNGSDHAVEIYKLYLSNTEIGQAILLKRSVIKAEYLAFGNVPSEYDAFRNNHHVVLATTGGYTNSSHQPEGFTTEQGNIVNPVMMPDRDGLAMVSDGGINVLDLNNDKFLLPGGGPTIKNPLNSLLAYAQLLEWCKNKHATIFQTHLLAYSDTLRIDLQKAKPDIRERRILALASDKNNVYHIIFNVTGQFKLAQIASEIFGLLKKRNLKVEAILNLDVGAFNILYVYDDSGNLIQYLKGPVDINQATNLLVYTQ